MKLRGGTLKQSTAEEILETYSLSELLELSDLTEAETVVFLVEEEFLELPETLPLHFED